MFLTRTGGRESVDITAVTGCRRIDNNIRLVHTNTLTHTRARIIIIYGENVFDLFIFTRGVCMGIHTAAVYSDETSRMEIIVKCNSSFDVIAREKCGLLSSCRR